MMADLRKLQFIDSHTGGEPTRAIVGEFPDLGGGTVAQQRDVFSKEFDALRKATVMEPRGSGIIVGALLVPACDPECESGVIYFNNVGVLNMCGHATIGVIATLAHMGRITSGVHRLETAVGVVTRNLFWRWRSFVRECSLSPPRGKCCTRPGGRKSDQRRYRVGRKLVFHGRESRDRPGNGQCRSTDKVLPRYSVRPGGREDHCERWIGNRSHRGNIVVANSRDERSELRALPWRSLRSFAMRNRNECEDCLPASRWEACTRGMLEAGRDSGKRVRRVFSLG